MTIGGYVVSGGKSAVASTTFGTGLYQVAFDRDISQCSGRRSAASSSTGCGQ